MDVKQRRLERLERRVARLDRQIAMLRARSDAYVRLRVGIAGVGLVITCLAFSQVGNEAGYFSAAASLLVFLVAATFHRRVQASLRRHDYWQRIQRLHRARIRLDWVHLPASRASAPPDHPFAHDLDIVGTRSLHRLLNTAVSLEGGNRLADWLLATEPDPEALTRRQALVRELTSRSHFRDRLTLYGWLAAGHPDAGITGDHVLAWFRQETATPPALRDVVLLSVLAGVTAALFIAAAQQRLPQWWMLTFLLYAGYSLFRLRELGDLFGQALSMQAVLRNLHGIFRYLEAYRFAPNSRLADLSAPFHDPRERPSAVLRRIGRIVTATSLRNNPILWTMVNAVVPWDLGFAYLLTRQRTRLSARMPVWLDTWSELEALNALAAFADLNPDYTLPVVRVGSHVEAQGIGHPLIPFEAKVGNDFSLTESGSVVLITGSNMSGKSSFLRTLGINLVLAYAGGPVNADHLDTALFRVFSTIRINDSLTEGFSYFYAEVRRLKRLLDALEAEHPYPLCFLIDEIFKGTNNRERLIGSRSYIHALAGRNGLGVVSTHDLELVQLADEIPQLRNAHFREAVVDGRMTFDYRLRPGPCPTTNALKIMQLEGLPVEIPDEARS
ncbi:MAG: hypothetical protein K8J31_15630 [Anaerolineae bacterium]|nr:hypothetical protein [Anaerolineae bacterium]